MDQDFVIEVQAKLGLSVLEQFLSYSPIELVLVGSEINGKILKQEKVSDIAGFEFESREDDIISFFMSVLQDSPLKSTEVISRFSEFLKKGNLPHRITEIMHDVDFDEECICYHWPSSA